ncbi:ALF repeat-containing protein [Kitasatospora sp. NPDC002040]|uniref:ALF repeat-containing protein n=1 Tax=Kitasatospora sp. NPDC002040 TaxID=3154661 RepID=UPI003321082E
MKIRRSIAAAVLLATAAAPVAMGATPAFADSTPVGQEQTDPAEAKADQENRERIERVLVYPNDYLLTEPSNFLRGRVAEVLAGTPADRARFLASELDKIRQDDAQVAIVRIMSSGGPAVHKAGVTAFESNDLELFRAFLKVGQFVARAEDENRAELQRIIDDPSTGPGVREGAQKALAGTAADVERFLKVGIKNAAESDDRVLLSQIMSRGGPAVRKAANAAMSGTIEDVREFLKVGQFVARAEDENRAELQRIIDDPNTGSTVREGAQKALAGTAADVEQFLKVGIKNAAEHDARILLSQIMSRGGPEVRKAANAAMAGSIEDVRKFLEEGQYVARAKDEAAAKAAAEAAQGKSTGTTVAPVSVTTGTTATPAPAATTDGQVTAGALAATGPTAPLGQLAVAGGAAVLLGAGAVVASRRRRSQA